jgi:hypothetical protein
VDGSRKEKVMNKEDRLMRAELEYMTKFEQGEAPSLEELIETYPDMREELTEFVLDYVSLETEADTVEPSEGSLVTAAAARENALRKALAEPGSLVEARVESGERLGTLAVAVNVPMDTLRALEKGLITAESVPGELFRRLSLKLGVSRGWLRQLVEMADAPAAGVLNRAEDAPQDSPRMTFEEAVRKSPGFNEDHEREWLACGPSGEK